MTDLQQRTPAWHKARAGKLTASNLAAYLGLNRYCSRNEAYARLRGIKTFEGNSATQWGCDNEQNGINAYQTRTGYVVQPTGIWTHPANMWLAGSPDGLVGEEGMIEVKCPFFKKQPHTEIPVYYYVQMNACLEITGRKWCDYVCWTPEAGTTMFRVNRDSVLFDFLLPYWGQIYSASQRGVKDCPPLAAEHAAKIRERVEGSMKECIDYTYFDRGPDEPDSPPCISTLDEEEFFSVSAPDEPLSPPTKRQREQ